jgi:hypothetical protein
MNPKYAAKFAMTTTLQECMKNSVEYCKKYRNQYKHANMIKKFNAILTNMSSNSQSSQDIFVLEMTDYKRSGTYVEIGTNSAKTSNNTYILERDYGWSGLLVEYDGRFVEEYRTYRPNSKYIIDDARNIDYRGYFDTNKYPEHIDYLQIDLDVNNRSTLDVLEKFDDTVFDKYKFGTVTFEHDIYTGDYYETRTKSREIFKRRGYIMLFGDVKVHYDGQYCEFEDWYIHPDVVTDTYFISKVKRENESLLHRDIISHIQSHSGTL